MRKKNLFFCSTQDNFPWVQIMTHRGRISNRCWQYETFRRLTRTSKLFFYPKIIPASIQTKKRINNDMVIFYFDLALLKAWLVLRWIYELLHVLVHQV